MVARHHHYTDAFPLERLQPGYQIKMTLTLTMVGKITRNQQHIRFLSQQISPQLIQHHLLLFKLPASRRLIGGECFTPVIECWRKIMDIGYQGDPQRVSRNGLTASREQRQL
jgi:hypothetical protein